MTAGQPRRGRVDGKVALLVGAGSGIGEAAAHLFAEEGATVVVADLRLDAARSVADAVGAAASAAEVDVTDDDSVRRLVRDTLARTGRIDILFVTAGGSLPEDTVAPEVDLAVWDRTMTLDARGTLLCARHVIPAMVAAGGGSIVNMSSGAALSGRGRAHVYAAAKGAVDALTRALAGAYARHNIRVNAICAGRVNTARVRAAYGERAADAPAADAPRSGADPFDAAAIIEAYPFWVGEPRDIAQIALFLASDASRMITGAAIPANGGRTAY